MECETPNTEHFCVHTSSNGSPSLTGSIAPETDLSIAMSDRESLLPRIAPRSKNSWCLGRTEGARESHASLAFAPGRGPTPGARTPRGEDVSCEGRLLRALSLPLSLLAFSFL